MANGNSFDYPMKGPFGMCLQKQLNDTFNQNVAFSESSWENAKQNCQYGCVLPPGIPQWPPGVTPLSAPAQFTTTGAQPGLSDAQVINSLQAKPFQFDSPFVVKNEYAKFVPNDSPAVTKSLSNGCDANIPSMALAPPTPSLSPTPDINPNLITRFFRSLVEAVRGMSYDAKNWSQLPGESTKEKLKFMMTHDSDRILVLTLGIIFVLAVITLIVLICVFACCRSCV